MTEETKVVRKKKNYKSRRFWMIYAIVVVVLLAIVAIININIWDAMIRYESAQPEYLIEEAIAKLQDGEFEVNITSTAAKFEDASAQAKAELMNAISGKELTYMLDSKSYDDENPIYDVLLDDTTVCKITLHASNQRSMMAILTVYDWSVESVDPVLSKGTKYVKITVPTNFSVELNGIVLGEDEQEGELVIREGFDSAAAYVDVPQYVTYVVKDLYQEPSVLVKDQFGKEVAISDQADLTDLSFDYAESEIDSELSAAVLKNAENYMNYFSTDLPNCHSSVEPIAYMFPADSNYLVLAEMYRTGDMWMYSDHDTPVFFDEAVTHYIAYSEELFTVRVSFKRSMILQNAGREYREEENDQIYIYVKVDGNWVIAEMMDHLN